MKFTTFSILNEYLLLAYFLDHNLEDYLMTTYTNLSHTDD